MTRRHSQFSGMTLVELLIALVVMSIITVGVTTMLTGLAGGLGSLFAVRLALGFGEGAAFPTATRAMASWLPAQSWGFARRGLPIPRHALAMHSRRR